MKKKTILLILLSFFVGIGVSTIFFLTMLVRHEFKMIMPKTAFEGDLFKYFTGESREEILQRLDEAGQKIAEEKGYESREELLQRGDEALQKIAEEKGYESSEKWLESNQYEFEISRPRTIWGEDLQGYLAGESPEETSKRIDEERQNFAEKKGFESWEKMLDAEMANIEITEEKENTDNRKDEDGFEQKD